MPIQLSTEPYPVLPIDALEAIIDQARDDTLSLRQLSLSCSAFQPRARYYLFSSIVVYDLEQMETSREFLDSRPWLPPLVRKVTLCGTAGQLEPDHRLNRNIRLLDIVPVHLLSRLTNLHTWKMVKRADGGGNMAASVLFHRSALSCYQRYGGRTTIQHLELSDIPFEDISDFIRLASAFSTIECLTCSHIWFRTAKQYSSSIHSPERTVIARQLKLKSLCVSICKPMAYSKD